ncbi:MAG TPA: molybdopterin-dependent oxidoreductase [Gemmatimonadales bacterium]|nr:molybdopterin-dependent oxidoreductase [Gemmatimonadales bacterium]
MSAPTLPTATPSVCPHCGMGCAVALQTEGGRLVRSAPRDRAGGPLCVRGKAGHAFVHHPDRLTTPLIRREWHRESDCWVWHGESRGLIPDPAAPEASWASHYRSASWDEALELVAERLGYLRDMYGPQVLAGLGSAKCSNEENYALVRLIRGALGSGNIDNCARLCHAASVAALRRQLGTAAASGSYGDLAQANVILLAGVNPTESYPALGTRLLKAVQRGTRLIVVDLRRTEIAEKAHLHLRPRPGTDAMLYLAMLHQVMQRKLVDTAFVTARTEGFEEVAEAARELSLSRASDVTGVPVEDIIAAAELFARGPASCTMWGMGLTQHLRGTEAIASLVNLALACGMVGRPGAAIMPIRGQNNVQGACDMGALPDVYPDHQPVVDAAVRARFAAIWGVPVERLATLPGHRSTAMSHADPPIRALYVLGENPALSGPATGEIEQWLRQLDFLVVHDLFVTETARFADVILPGAAFAEKEGTYVNAERRIQLGEVALLPPGEARHELAVLAELTERLGVPVRARDAAGTMEEIARACPDWAGVSYGRLRSRGSLQHPVTAQAPSGTERLYTQRFSTPSGRAQFLAMDVTPPQLEPNPEFPFVVLTGGTRFHRQTATMTRRGPDLNQRNRQALATLHPDDLARLGLGEGDWVHLSSPHARITLQVGASKQVQHGQVFLPTHFREAAVNRLVGHAVDPRSGTPSFKHLMARIERAEDPAL